MQFPVRLLPVGRSGKLPRSRPDSLLGGTGALGGYFSRIGHTKGANYRRRASSPRGSGGLYRAVVGDGLLRLVDDDQRASSGRTARAADRRGAAADQYQPGLAGAGEIRAHHADEDVFFGDGGN